MTRSDRQTVRPSDRTVRPTYHPASQAWTMYHAQVLALIHQFRVRRVCDIGGGRNPTLSLDEVRSLGVEYTLLDISAAELEKAPAGYVKVQADITKNDGRIPTGFDLAISIMLAEHVKDGRAFHENVRRLLAPGGIAFHFFPTLYAVPFVINRLIPERLSSWLLDTLAPRDRRQHEKFPAYYSWCRGPTGRQMRRLEQLQYRIVEYKGFFGHDYFIKIPVLRRLERLGSQRLLRKPVPALTTYAQVVLQKAKD